MVTIQRYPVFLVLSLLFQRAISKQKPITDEEAPPYTCEDPPYDVHIFSQDPLVIYINNFITPSEAEHLQDLTKDSFSRSAVADSSGQRGARSTRTSQSASVPYDDVVRCIQSRALNFQGFDIPPTHLEPLQLVQYGAGENYHLHTDWFTSPSQTISSLGGNRQSSFFVYVAAENVTGGGTNFPLLDAPRDERWCKFVDCDESWENGVTFRPRVGSAVFWRNLRMGKDGNMVGDERTIHAGLPVVQGRKVGMNIWTREYPLDEEFRGGLEDL